jgi:hypothetical protein
MATNVIAVIYDGMPKTHPINSATSPTIPVIIPIKVKATIKAYLPPPHLIGGMIENNNFQLISKN